MIRARSMLGVLTVALALIAACGGDDDAVSPVTEPGTTFEVGVGDEFTVVLESNVTTGYAWTLEVEPPAGIVRLVSDVYVEPDTDAVGAGGRQELTFEATGEGDAVVELWYVRSFDDPLVPADQARFDVVVSGA